VAVLVVPATTFSLSDGSVRVTVSVGHDGPTVTYSGADGEELRRTGDDVAVARTPVGTWYTVTTATDRPREAFSTLLSVLVPVVGCLNGSDPHEAKPVSTVAVETVQVTDTDQRVGQVGSYRTLTLTGGAARA
jgi:hypothetical protein